MIENIAQFKDASKEFLSDFPLGQLRSYAREIGVVNPTKDKKKGVLLDAIVAVLAGEIAPQAPSSLGAPVKRNMVDPHIKEGIEKIRAQYSYITMEEERPDDCDFAARLKQIQDNPFTLVLEDPHGKDLENDGIKEIFRGQLQTLNNVPMLLPLNCIDSEEKMIVPAELIQAYDLRDGDRVSCYARKTNSCLVASRILTLNDLVVGTYERVKFEEEEVCFPREKIRFYSERCNSLTSKTLQWVLPIGKGQRGLIVSPPKAGKSEMLYEMASATSHLNKNLFVIVLLVDEPPENISRFRKVVNKENLLYTTYEDSPERQVFVADFALKRAKRFSEMGINVLLLVDSFNALARAYNDTEASAGGKMLSCGLESKTVQYLKRYFGTARCFEKRGSVTIVGTVSSETGNPADDVIKTELTSIGNLEIHLNEDLAKRRVYPAIDFANTQGNNLHLLLDEKEEAFTAFVRNEYLPAFGMEALLGALEKSTNAEELEKLLRKQMAKK